MYDGVCINQLEQRTFSDIQQALKEEIQKNRDGIVDALYPILGKMIKKTPDFSLDRDSHV